MASKWHKPFVVILELAEEAQLTLSSWKQQNGG